MRKMGSVPIFALIVSAATAFAQGKIHPDPAKPRPGDADPEDTISYTNVNPKVGLIAVYAGASLEQAQELLAAVKQTGRFPGANPRRMQAVLGYP
jgi:hypothetical protein